MKKKVLIIVENLPLPFDRRVWQEANSLCSVGYLVSIISPKTQKYNKGYEFINGIHIYRHFLPKEGNGAWGYFFEYSVALICEFVLALYIFFRRGFDIIHACNPPDLIFLVAAPFKLLGKKFIFDHHDINPELYIAKFGKKNLFYHLLLFLEKMTFKLADISIATNNSYKKIAIERGGMLEENVFVVRSGPNLSRLVSVIPDSSIKNNKKFLVAYVGVIGQQEGIDHLLESIQIIVNNFRRTDIYFVICGSGPVLNKMITYSRDLGIQEFVNFTGRISDELLMKILNTADVCVNPDVWNEMNDKSTMNKIMEYMAIGKPIVQYDLCEGKYSAQDASLYAIPNDRKDFASKIISLIENDSLRSEMGSKGKKRVENDLQWKIEEKKLLKAYSQLN